MIKAVDEFILSPFNRSGLCTYDMERDTGFEPAPSAWKAEMLAADTNPALVALGSGAMHNSQ